MSKSEIDQTRDGIKAITVCIVQVLSEIRFYVCTASRSASQSMVRSPFRSRRGSRSRACSERPTGTA